MAKPSDEQLVQRVLAGDRHAFAVLIGRYAQPLTALIRREIADRHHCEDVLQETLLQVWRSLGQLRDRSKLKAWLVGVARNRCRDFHKSPKRREKPTDDGMLETYINRTGRAIRGGGESEDSLAAMRRVPLTQRRTAELFYVEGLTIPEIARRLARPEGTIKSRLFHARSALRQTLRPRAPEKE